VADHTGEIDGLPVFWRSASGATPEPSGAAVAAQPLQAADAARAPPVLYLHGVPDSSDEWLAFLQRTGGLAPDLPGFGRTGKPGYLKYTIDEYDHYLERFLDELDVQRVSIVMHDWGAVGLAFAQRLPERVARLVLVNAVPLLGGYRWHRIARVWRTPGLGELAMGATNRFTLGRLSRETNATPGPMPQEWLDSVLAHFDQGTQRAILRLYRSSPPEVLQAAGRQLGRLDVPALVVWGLKDPYIPARFAQEYVDALPYAQLLELADAGHYPWLDRPEVVERVADFLASA
jgi:pimeloyl-ACP methyl ester carboxylesterase